MNRRFTSSLLSACLLFACQQRATDPERFHAQMDHLISKLPMNFDQLNTELDGRLRPLRGTDSQFQASLTRNVELEGNVTADVVWVRTQANNTHMYFEFSGSPCYSPAHFKSTYYPNQIAQRSLADGVSNIYRLLNPRYAVGMMTITRDNKECITNIILRSGEANELKATGT